MFHKSHWGGPYIDHNGEGFFPIPAFNFYVAHQGQDANGPWVYITFGIVWGNHGVYLTYYRTTGGWA